MQVYCNDDAFPCTVILMMQYCTRTNSCLCSTSRGNLLGLEVDTPPEPAVKHLLQSVHLLLDSVQSFSQSADIFIHLCYRGIEQLNDFRVRKRNETVADFVPGMQIGSIIARFAQLEKQRAGWGETHGTFESSSSSSNSSNTDSTSSFSFYHQGTYTLEECRQAPCH